MRVLVVEDDRGISDGLRTSLGRQGYAVDCVATRTEAWAALCAAQFDLILLDLGLPDGDGTQLLQQLRTHTRPQPPDPDTPVLIMTARDAVASRVRGLDLGADDYVTKPFDVDELGARMRALRRRAAGRAQAVLRRGGLVVDPAAYSATVDGRTLELPPRELALLVMLLDASPRVLTRNQIEAKLYGFDTTPESNAIEVHIYHLRRKVGDDVIRNVRGVGYFVPPYRA